MAAEVPLEEGKLPAPQWAPQPRAPGPRRGVPTTCGCENQQGSVQVRWRAALDPGVLLKGLSTDSQTLTLNHREGTAAGKAPGVYREEMN